MAKSPPPQDEYRLAAFRARLKKLEDMLDSADSADSADPADPADPAKIRQVLQELRVALEEVEVTDEELTLQNEELLVVREALERERERFENLFQFAPDSYFVTDASGTVLEANRAAIELLNVPRRALRGKPLAVFVDDHDRPRFRSHLAQLAREERLAPWEMRLCPRRQPTITVLLTVSRADRVGGGPPDLLWIVRDVSEVRATEQALRDSEERLRHSQRLEAVGRLAGGIAHSFNNLLAAIAFHAELVEEGLHGVSGEARLTAHVEEIKQAGERAATLAGQLLAFGRKQVRQPRVLEVNALLAEREPVLRQLIGEDVELDLRLDPEAGAVEADLAQLEQVVLNLLVNARDAMPDGGRCTIETAALTIAAEAPPPGVDLPPGTYVRLAMADTGVGMDEEVRAHLFEPFFTTKERDKGTGLGLATVYGIVRQSGGDVRVESAPGAGARFEVFLPRVAARAEPAEPRPAARSRRRGTEVILLVEDEENIRTPALEILEAQGYRVLAAGNGSEAAELAERARGPIHLLVTDVIMPGLTGSQLAERLAAARPEMKVLYISGYPEDAIARHGVLQPGCSFLQKPFPPAQLLRTIREVLDGITQGVA